MNWTVTVLIICCGLAVFSVWKEYRRTRRSNLILRIVASLIAIGSMACIAIPLTYVKNVSDAYGNSVVLLTRGFNRDSIDHNAKVFTVDKDVQQEYPSAVLVRPDELKDGMSPGTTLHIFGYGFNEDELQQLDHLPVIFHAPAQPEGFTAVNWNRNLKTGETLNVQGKYKNDRSQPIRLVLRGLSTVLDTLSVAAKKSADFELNSVPKTEGRAVYHLLAIAGADTLSNEPLPIQVAPIKPLKILMLSASPDFETKFLKNWLSENGFSVAVRSAISKEKFSSEFVNMPQENVDHLNSGLLDKFDLVIGDLSVLKPQAALLKQQVMQKGLGIIIRADSTSKTASWLQDDFPVEQLNVKNPPPVSFIINGEKDKTEALKIGPNYIKPQPGTQTLVNDDKGRNVANTSLAGEGRLVFTTINNSYNWMLFGDKDDYAAFWSLLITKAARKLPINEQWSVTTSFPTTNRPAGLTLETSSMPGQVNSGNSVIAPAQNPLIPFEWNSTYWPSAAGWQSVKQKNGKLAWWYAYGENEWAAVKAAEKMAATRHYAETYTANASVTKAIQKKQQIEMPKIYFYLLLLAACSYLWVEGKGLSFRKKTNK